MKGRAFALLAMLAVAIPFSAAGAQEDKPVTIAIPKGAANPTIDLTLQNLAKWYDPRTTTVPAGSKVVWENRDTEPHTVTSGRGAGIASVQTNEKGEPDGIFDSGFFGPGESWSRTFYTLGTFTYFCTIHPWMEGMVTVAATDLPDYPVNAAGNRHDPWPAHTFSDDGEYDIDMKWDPLPVMTGETITFFVDFFDARTNERLQLTPYEFVLVQDGKELDRTYGLTDVGTAIYKYKFSKPGPITMRVEQVGGRPGAWSEFSTIVYPNPDPQAFGQDAEVTKVSGGTEPASRLINPLTLVTFTYAVIFGLPAAVGVTVILFKKGKI